MEVRNATLADVATIAALWAQANMGSGLEVDSLEIKERLHRRDDFFVIGEIAGVAMATAMGCYDGHRGHVKRVAVSPAHQGAGFGRQIMADIEERFRAHGVTKLRLQVWNTNVTGARFWENTGWTELPEIRYFTKDLAAGLGGPPDDGC